MFRFNFFISFIFIVLVFVLVGCSSGLNSSGSNEVAIEITGDSSNAEAEEFKKSVEKISYIDLARNPEKYVGRKVLFTGKVVQMLDQLEAFRMAVTSNTQYNNDFTDALTTWDHVVYVNFSRNSNGKRILKDDHVRVWGVVNGLKTSQNTEGVNMYEPEITAKYFSFDLYDSAAPQQNVSSSTNVVEETNDVYVEATIEPTVEPVLSDDSISQDSNEMPLSVKADSAMVEGVYTNYVTAMIEAINTGDFSIVESYLKPGSSLYNSQKALVDNLYRRNITESLLENEILDYEYDEFSGEFRVKVREVIQVNKPTKTTTADDVWIYTMDENWLLTKIERP